MERRDYVQNLDGNLIIPKSMNFLVFFLWQAHINLQIKFSTQNVLLLSISSNNYF
jgi:hypothetical protein